MNSSYMNNDHKRLFVASSELFSGFQVDINITEIDTLDDIVKIFLDRLIKVLKDNKFTMLVKKLNETKFHIHSHTLEEILTSERNTILYVCNHCQ